MHAKQSNQSNNDRKLCTEIQVEARFFMSMSSLDSAEVLLFFHLQCDFSSCAYSSRSSWGKAAVQRSPTLSRAKVGVKQQCFISPHTRGSRMVSRIVAVSPKVRRYLTRCCSALNIYQSLCHSWRYPARHCRTDKNPGRPCLTRTRCRLCVFPQDYLDMMGLSVMFPRVEVFLIQGSPVDMLERPQMDGRLSSRRSQFFSFWSLL